MTDNEQKVDLLVFGAHADDIELACGGTVLRARSLGQRVGLVDLTRGEMGTRGTADIRRTEAEEARRRLGALFRVQCDFGDGGLRTTRDQELQVIELIRRHRPSVVLAPFPDDRHPDHTRAGQLVAEASFYAGLRKIETSDAAHRPQTVAYFYQNYHDQAPSFIVDVSDVFEQKMHAIAAYASQFHKPDSPEPQTIIAKESFLKLIEGRARHFGGLIGADFGEPFHTKQPPKVNDIVAAYSGREVS